MSRHVVVLSVLVTLLLPRAADGQLLDKLKKKVRDASATVADARALRCEVQGVCGQVTAASHFDPELYESVAVTIIDGTKRSVDQGTEGLVRDAFEARLVENGYMLAASADAAAVRERIGRDAEGWTDERLAQLKDFVHGIDAVLVVDIRQVDLARCADDPKMQQATVHMSARWLHVDAGDVPWVAQHQATACDAAPSVRTTGLTTTASQLATTLPSRDGS